MYEIYEKLRDSLGLSNYQVSQETGISQATLSDWKHGKYAMKAEKLAKIADLFDVPVDYLMTGEMPKYYTNDETANIAQEIFENKEMRALFSAAKDASPEDLKTAHQMLLALKRKEKGYDD